MLSTPNAKPGFYEYEWNFDQVTAEELKTCCLWEYGRESYTFAITSIWHLEMFARSSRGTMLPSSSNAKIESFLEAFWNCDEGYIPLYDAIRREGGPEAPAWQQLPADYRTKLTGLAGIHSINGPLQPAKLHELETLWNFNLITWEPVRNRPGYDPGDDSMAYDDSRPQISKPGHLGQPHGSTVVAFSVDFRQFGNRQICDDFMHWLKANRPQDCPEPSTRGHKQRDLRVALDRLGMMRLLHRFTLREMPKHQPKAAKAFDGYEWYKERKRAGKTFNAFFPFLPKNEKPLSWPTKGRRGKWSVNGAAFDS